MVSQNHADLSPSDNPHKVVTKRTRRLILYIELLALDVACLVAAFMIAGLVRDGTYVLSGLEMAAMVVPIYLAYALQREVYNWKAIISARETLAKTWLALFYTIATIVILLYVVRAGESVSRIAFGVGTGLSFVLLSIVRSGFPRHARHQLQGSPVNELLIIDDAEIDLTNVKDFVYAKDVGVSVALNDPQMLMRFGLLIEGYERAIVACSVERRAAWTVLLRGANVEGEIIAPEFDSTGVLSIARYSNHSTYVVSRGALSTSSRIQKRLLDIGFTVPAIIVLAPLLILVAIAVKLDSPGPVLFKQPRVGRGNRSFKIMKFRSMRAELSDTAGGRSTGRDDDRVTRVGKIIRKTSIDELPQLFNVLWGDMSLVGPRPHALGSLAGDALFWEVDQNYWLRHALKPGITGLAQVRGFRGATEQRSDLVNRLRADLEYIENWTISNEIVILLRTANVLIHRNAF